MAELPTKEEAEELRRGFIRRSTEILISLAEKNATLPAAIQNDYAARAEKDLERLKVILEIGLRVAYPDEETVEGVARAIDPAAWQNGREHDPFGPWFVRNAGSLSVARAVLSALKG